MSDSTPGKPLSDREVAIMVATYFDMLMLELSGQRFSKSAMRRDLLPKLDGRSEGPVSSSTAISVLLQPDARQAPY